MLLVIYHCGGGDAGPAVSSDEEGVPLRTGSRGSSTGEGDWVTVQACSGKGDLPAWSAARPSLFWLRVRPGAGPFSDITHVSSRLMAACVSTCLCL